MRGGRSVPPIPDVREATRALLSAVDFRGYASAEFKRDPRDGRPKLIEVNVRLPRNAALMARSGIDFARLVYADLVDEVATPVIDPVIPSTFIDLTADLGNLLTRDRGMLRRPARVVGPYLARRKLEAVWSWSDTKPMATMIAARLRRRSRTFSGA